MNIDALLRADTRSGLDHLAEAVRNEPEGNRNHILYWAAIKAAEEGFEPDDIHAQLLDAAQAAGLQRRESRLTIQSGLQKATQDGLWGSALPASGRKGHLPDSDAMEAAFRAATPGYPADWPVDDAHIARWYEENPDTEDGNDPDLAAFPPVSALMEAYDPARDVFTVDRLLRPGYRALLAAYEGTGKTYIAMQLALHLAYPDLAMPSAVFGHFAVHEPLAVLYVDGEIGEGESLRRLTALMRELGIAELDENFRLLTLDTRLISLRDKADLTFLRIVADKVHARTGRKVILFLDSTDSLYGRTLWGADSEGYEEAIKWLMDGRRDWLIILTAVHTVKKPRDQKGTYKVDLQDVLGNVTRQADVVLIIDQKGERALTMGVYKRPGRSNGVLQRDEGRHVWRWTADMGEQVGDAWKVSREVVLQTMGTERWTAGRLAQALPEKVDKNTARNYLDQLVKADIVESDTDDRNVVWYWVRTDTED